MELVPPLFPPLKPKCVLWSGASYSLKNTVYIIFLTVLFCYVSLTQLTAFLQLLFIDFVRVLYTKTTGEPFDYTQVDFLNVLSEHQLDNFRKVLEGGS